MELRCITIKHLPNGGGGGCINTYKKVSNFN